MKQPNTQQIKHKIWMLYGCTGYSGKLIAKECKRQGLNPILAGRDPIKVKQIADDLGFTYRVFDLSEAGQIERNISDCFMLFNAAGPFTQTCEPLLKACLNQKVHNLSLVGEVPLLETLQQYDQSAKDAEVLLAVGLGYDVIPTDCLANTLKAELPDATHLTIGMQGASHMSPGSTKEMIEQLGEQPFWLRRNGKLVEGKASTKHINVGQGEIFAMTIAWGDLSSAYFSTGIPNITVYASLNRIEAWLMQGISHLKPLIRIKSVQNTINRLIDRFVAGPNEYVLEETPVYFLAEAMNLQGKTVRAKLKTASGYKLTYLGAVYSIKHVLEKSFTHGYQTPAQLLGSNAIEAIEGSSNIEIIP